MDPPWTPLWTPYGRTIDPLWSTCTTYGPHYGPPMVPLWTLWTPYRRTMDPLWTHGPPMDLLWTHYGLWPPYVNRLMTHNVNPLWTPYEPSMDLCAMRANASAPSVSARVDRIEWDVRVGDARVGDVRVGRPSGSMIGSLTQASRGLEWD